MADRTRAWVNTTPADSDKVGKGDDEIRNLRVDLDERLQVAGIANGVSVVIDGRHAVASGSRLSPDIYRSNGTSRLVAFEDSGMTVDPDAIGGIGIFGPNVTSSKDPGHTHTKAISFILSGTAVVGRVKIAFRVPRAVTVLGGELIVFTAPTSASTVVQLHIAQAPGAATNPNSISDATVFLTRPTIPIGSFFNATTSLATTALSAGDWLIPDITAAGGAADLMLTLRVH